MEHKNPAEKPTNPDLLLIDEKIDEFKLNTIQNIENFNEKLENKLNMLNKKLCVAAVITVEIGIKLFI